MVREMGQKKRGSERKMVGEAIELGSGDLPALFKEVKWNDG